MSPQELQLSVAFNVSAVFFFALTAAAADAAMTLHWHLPAFQAAVYATLATVVVRVFAILFNSKTRAVEAPLESP